MLSSEIAGWSAEILPNPNLIRCSELRVRRCHGYSREKRVLCTYENYHLLAENSLYFPTPYENRQQIPT